MHPSINIAQKFLDLSQDPVANDITPMKLLKLVYIAHGWMLALADRPLISEDVEAWQYGPVIPELYGAVRHYKGSPVESLEFATLPNLTDAEDSIITQVFDIYGKLSGIELSSMTHQKGTPWHQIWHEKVQSTIPNDLIASYYKSLASNS